MLSMVQPLVSGVAAAFRQLGLQFLTLHKAVAKLGYIVTSLLSGVMQEGFCTATESEETEAGRQVTRCGTSICSSQVHCLLRWGHSADCGVADVHACTETACCMTDSSTTASLGVNCALPLVQRHLCLSLVHVVWVSSKTIPSLVLGASQRLLGHMQQQALYAVLSPFGEGGGCLAGSRWHILNSTQSPII